MINAKRDQNNTRTLICPLNTDGTTITLVKVNPANHGLKVEDNTTGSNYGPVNASRDENGVPVLMGISSVDGITPVAVYADLNGKLLVQSS